MNGKMLSLCCFAAAAALLPAAGGTAFGQDAMRGIETALTDGSTAEKAEECEKAYEIYQQAAAVLSQVGDEAKRRELSAVLTTKLYKLKPCYDRCHPSEEEKAIYDRARRAYSHGEQKRATRMVKRLLVGKSEKCTFWAQVAQYNREISAGAPTRPGEVEEDIDPCQMGDEQRSRMESAKTRVEAIMTQLTEYQNEPPEKLYDKLDDIINLYREVDDLRIQIFSMREEFLECDEVYDGLKVQSETLKNANSTSGEIISTTYTGKVRGLTARVGGLSKRLKDTEAKLKSATKDISNLRLQLEQLNKFNEDILDDMISLASVNIVKIQPTVEGQPVGTPFETLQTIFTDEKKVLETLSVNFPEYFKDGINQEALKRQRFVLAKMGDMMKKFHKEGGPENLSLKQSLESVDASVKIIDKALETAGEAEEAAAAQPPSNTLLIIALAVIIAAAAGAVAFILMRRGRKSPEDSDLE